MSDIDDLAPRRKLLAIPHHEDKKTMPIHPEDAVAQQPTRQAARTARAHHHRSARALAEKMLKLAQLSGQPLTDAQKSYIYVNLPESRGSLEL